MSPSLDYGDINELLREANGEISEEYVWPRKRRQVETPPVDVAGAKEKDKSVNDIESEESEEKEADTKAAGLARHAGKANKTKKSVEAQTGNTASSPPPSPPSFPTPKPPPSQPPPASVPHRTRKTAEQKPHVPDVWSDGDHASVMEALRVYHEQKDDSGRHLITMPNKLYHDIVASYGQRNLSAILCTLARQHVEKHKEAMMQMIASRTDFFE